MANIVKGTIGDDDVELNNAATEVTLSALLNIAKVDSKVLMELAKQAKVDKGILDKLAKQREAGTTGSGDKSSKSLEQVSKKGSMLGNVLSDLVGGVTATIGNLAGFSQTLLDGKASGEAFFTAFKDLPLGLGLFAQMLAFAQKMQSENLDVYTAISSSGAGVVGAFNQQKLNYLKLYMTQEEYIAFIKKNSDVMEQLTHGNQQGGTALLDINRAIVSSGMGKSLRALGYTYAEINDLLPTYLRMTGDGIQAGKNQKEEFNRLMEATRAYGEDLDFLARFSRTDRQTLAEKIKAANEERVFKSWQLTQQQYDKKQVSKAIADTVALFGPGATDEIQAGLANFVGSSSKNAKTLQSMQPHLYAVTKQIEAEVKAGTYYGARRDQLLAKAEIASQKDVEMNLANIQSNLSNRREMTEQQAFQLDRFNKQRAQGQRTLEDKEKEIASIHSSTEANKLSANGAVENEKKFKEMAVELMTSLQGLIVSLTNVGNRLIDKFDSLVKDSGVMDKFQNAMERVGLWVEQVFSDPQGAFDRISSYLKELFAKFFSYLAKSKLGEALFGDAAKSLKESAVLDYAKSIDQARLKALEEKEKDKSISPAEQGELKEYRDSTKEALHIISERMRNAEYDKDAAREKVMRSLREKGLDPEGQHHYDIDLGRKVTNLEAGLAEENKRFRDQANTRIATAQKLETGGYSQDEIARILRKGFQGLDMDGFAGGTIGSGKMVRDFGTEKIAKLHGKEAVLTEEQLTNLASGAYDAGASSASNNGNSRPIEIPEMKILAETLVTLNKQAVIQTKVLEQVADYQKKLLDKTRGNRLLG